MSEQQTPLQRWSTMVEIARNWPLSDERQPPLERALVEIAAYAERLENHKAALIETVIEYRAQLAAHTRWPQGDEAVEQLARAVHFALGQSYKPWDDTSDYYKKFWKYEAAAVLARLHAQEADHADAD